MSAIEKQKQIDEICKKLILTQETLDKVSQKLLEQIEKGLKKSTNSSATVKCFPTYVKELPNGRESGKFLALDLGGTNFRVLLIDLGAGKFTMESKIFSVSQRIMLGPGTALFDHIAECLASFMKEHGIVDVVLPLGFTFSFPCTQVGLTEARLTQWTKGFKCEGVVGQDVVKLLKDAVARRDDINIDITAVLNDTTGTLMSCAWKRRECYIGLIIGTGTNACYMENIDNVELYNGSKAEPKQVIVNTEWGAFGIKGELDFLRTHWDRAIDAKSINPGEQIFEKMISGMYMGEVVRLVLLELNEKGLVFTGEDVDGLEEQGKFFTKYVSEIESDKANDYHNCRMVLEELGMFNITDEDCRIVQDVCKLVSTRAAYLTSAGVATLLNKMKRPKCTVAVDGSVYRFHPHFHDLMMQKIKEMSNNVEMDLMLSEDGSGRGAALVAAVAYRLAGEEH